ncbi:MAG TPA: hypothetical protein PLH31_20260, partial [Caulobacter sp.]|nr:hypothetical protein [Caulobacter sp.]
MLTRTKQAISGNESGGRYDAVGPDTGSGKRAYGKYQVMDFNVGPWTQEALGRPMTPQEFLASPDAQEAVADFKLGQYIKQYGSPEAAARAWFAGPGGMNNTAAKDVLGTTVGGYGQKFAQAYGAGATGPQPAQGSDMPPADASGTPAPPQAQPDSDWPSVRDFVKSQYPGAKVLGFRDGSIAYDKQGRVRIKRADGQDDAVDVPKAKAPGAEKGLFGDSLTGRALTALRTLTPDQQDYAAAYAILSKPQVISDGAGGQTIIQPMDLSMYPKPAYGAGRGVQTPAGGSAPTPIPGGGTIQNIPGKGKPLDNSARDDLTKASGGVLELTELVKSFDSSFGGYMLDSLGDADNFRKRNLP